MFCGSRIETVSGNPPKVNVPEIDNTNVKFPSKTFKYSSPSMFNES